MKTIIEKVTIKSTILGIVAFLIVTMSLFHVFFDSSPPELSKNKTDYKSIINKRDSLQAEYLSYLYEGSLSPKQYYIQVTNLLENSEKEIEIVNKEKKLINISFSFRGRSSFHFWIFVFGLSIALMFFSCKSLYDDFNSDKIGFKFLSLSGISVSFFWIIHLLFFTQKDFSKNSYIVLILVCSILCTCFTYFLMRFNRRLKIKKFEREKESKEFERLSFKFIEEVNNVLLKEV